MGGGMHPAWMQALMQMLGSGGYGSYGGAHHPGKNPAGGPRPGRLAWPTRIPGGFGGDQQGGGGAGAGGAGAGAPAASIGQSATAGGGYGGGYSALLSWLRGGR